VHKLPAAPNILDQDFSASAPNQAWCGDITYIATDEGWPYLAGLKDLFSGELVGYANERAHYMKKHLVMQALFRLSRRPDHRPVSSITQTAAAVLRQRLPRARPPIRHAGIISRRGNCFDNATIESFWDSLKTNSSIIGKFATREQAQKKSQNTSRFFITGSAHTSVLTICRWPLSLSDSICTRSLLNPLASAGSDRPTNSQKYSGQMDA
jgi:putative transposase